MTTGTRQHTLEHGAPLVDAAVSPDGEHLLTVGTNDTVKMWDMVTGEPRTDLPKTASAKPRIMTLDDYVRRRAGGVS